MGPESTETNKNLLFNEKESMELDMTPKFGTNFSKWLLNLYLQNF